MNRAALLAGLAVLLGGVLAAELWLGPVAAPALVVGASVPARPAPPAAAEAAPDLAASVDRILARPLFTPGRRPAADPTLPIGRELPRLTGIVITPAGRRAIFAATGTGRSIVVTEGDSIGGYVVRTIAPARVVVSRAEGDRVIHPSLAKEPTAAEQAAAVVPPP